MLYITLCICLSIECDALDVAGLSAVALRNDPECAAGNLDLSLVEERCSEPVASRCRLDLIESE